MLHSKSYRQVAVFMTKSRTVDALIEISEPIILSIREFTVSTIFRQQFIEEQLILQEENRFICHEIYSTRSV